MVVVAAVPLLLRALASTGGAGGDSRVIALIFAIELVVAAGAFLGWRFAARREPVRAKLALVLRLRDLPGLRSLRSCVSMAALARAFTNLAAAVGRLDRFASDSDGALAAGMVRKLAAASAWMDVAVVDRAARVPAGAVESLSMPARLWQSGRARSYLLWISVGLVALLAYCLLQAAH